MTDKDLIPSFEPVYGAEELQEKRVAHTCIGDPWLSAKIEKSPEVAVCDYSGEEAPTWPLGAIAKATLAALQRHYAPQTWYPDDGADYLAQKYGPGDWEPAGEPVDYVIVELLELDDNPMAEDIRVILSHKVDTVAPGDPQPEAMFDDNSYWAFEPVREGELRWRWEDLETSLKTETRLFNRQIEEFFTEMFDAASRLSAVTGQDFLKMIGPEHDIRSVYRSRVFQSQRALESAMERPDLSLGAPPSALARAGRMNPAGISVFYGATTPELTFAELRPPVGSTVFTGKFDITRPLTVLNADALSEMKTSGSFFDPDYEGDLAYADFFKSLRSRISRAVMPGEEELDYLPTQAIAEFLARRHNPPLDGILFESAQSNAEGRNLVLFSQACGVKSLDCPASRTRFLVSTTDYDGDQLIPDYSVHARVKKYKKTPRRNFFDNPAFDDWDEPPKRAPTALSLDIEALQVHHIKGVQIDTDAFKMKWQRDEEIVEDDDEPKDGLPF
jgi:hypothetical protein